MPTVSVIVTTYNHKNFIATCIKSILAQTYSDFEILITDDCSNDGAIEVLKQIENWDKRITILYSEKNKGLSNNINKAFKKATGKYIAIIAGDDIMMPDKLQKQVECLENNSDVGICLHDMIVFDSDTDKDLYVFSEKYGIPSKIEDNLFFTNWFFAKDVVKTLPSTTLARRDYLLQNLFDERLKIANEVLHAWLNYAGMPNLKLKFIHETLGKYRIHSNNLHFQGRNTDTGVRELFVMYGITVAEAPHIIKYVKNYTDFQLFSSLLYDWIPSEKRKHFTKVFFRQAGMIKFLYLFFCKMLKKMGILFLFFKPLRLLYKITHKK